MKQTTPFLFLYLFFISFISTYSAEAPLRDTVEVSQQFLDDLLLFNTISDISYTVRLFFLCLNKTGRYDIGWLRGDVCLLSENIIEISKHIFLNARIILDYQQAVCSLVDKNLFLAVNEILKDCFDNHSNLDWESLKYVVDQIKNFQKAMKGLKIEFKSEFFDKALNTKILNLKLVYERMFDLLADLVEREPSNSANKGKRKNEKKTVQVDKNSSEYIKKLESSNLSAHILIGCCTDGKCGSLDVSKKKDKAPKKKNRGGKKRVGQECQELNQGPGNLQVDQDEMYQEEPDKIQVSQDDQLLMEAVESVNKVIKLLKEITTFEEKLVLSSQELTMLADQFKELKITRDENVNNISERAKLIVESERNYRHSFKNTKTETCSKLKLMSLSSFFKLNGEFDQHGPNICHHSTHSCNEKNKKQIENPD